MILNNKPLEVIMKNQEQKVREIIENLEPIKSLKPKPENQEPFNVWCPINGEWIHLIKTSENKFYVNGKLQKNYPHVT